MCLHRKHNPYVFVLLSMGFVVAWSANAARAGDETEKKKRPDIYDVEADGNKQIAEALAVAKRDHKRVLLMFGANWCGWCHKLHELFDNDQAIARQLLYGYELVLIDVDEIDGKKHNADVIERYGNPVQHGLPVLVVLDADGKQLVTQETGALERGDAHDPAKVLGVLKKWRAKPVNVHRVPSAAEAPATMSEDDAAAIRRAHSDFVLHAVAGDWDALLALYTEEAVVMPPNQALVIGRSAIRNLFSAMTISDFQLEPIEIDGRGDLAFARGTYSWTVRVGEGEPVTDHGKWLTIWRRQAGGTTWLLSQDIWNSDRAP